MWANCVDGGLVANNPEIIAFKEAQLHVPANRIRCIISLGTGSKVHKNPSSSAGVLYWERKCVDLALSSDNTHEVFASKLGGNRNNEDHTPKVLRFNPDGLGEFQLDDCSTSTLATYVTKTTKYLQTERVQQQLEQLRTLLAPHRRGQIS